MLVSLEQIISAVAAAIDTFGVTIIVLAIAKTLIAFLQIYVRSWKLETPPTLRLSLGRSLTLGLDFQVAGDILRIALSPTVEQLGYLAALILLRAALNFFIERDIRIEQANETARAKERLTQ